jgi:hypothetical protein
MRTLTYNFRDKPGFSYFVFKTTESLDSKTSVKNFSNRFKTPWIDQCQGVDAGDCEQTALALT